MKFLSYWSTFCNFIKKLQSNQFAPYTVTISSLSEFETFSFSKQVIAERINLRGCITTTRRILIQDVKPIIVGWIWLGCILLLVDVFNLLISLVKLFSRENSEDISPKSTKGSEEMPLSYTSSISLTLSKNHL